MENMGIWVCVFHSSHHVNPSRSMYVTRMSRYIHILFHLIYTVAWLASSVVSHVS